MPTAPPAACRYPLCPRTQPCPIHTRKRPESTRPNVGVRRWYHIARWNHPRWGLRATILTAMPWCAECHTRGHITPAVDVDHILPHQGDPALFWDRANLMALCKQCHARKTARGL
jgi:5-methylcytosine-specific restriction protein A